MGCSILYNNHKQSIIYYIYNKKYKILLLKKTPLTETKSSIKKNFFLQFQKHFLKKIKFSGKGYKIKKNTKSSLILLFNRAHIVFL